MCKKNERKTKITLFLQQKEGVNKKEEKRKKEAVKFLGGVWLLKSACWACGPETRAYTIQLNCLEGLHARQRWR